MSKTDQALEPGQEPEKIESAQEAAVAALSEASQKSQSGQSDQSDDTANSNSSAGMSDQLADEVAKSDDFADTLHSLETLIESKAKKLMRLKQTMKKKRQMIKSVFENDNQLAETEEKKAEVYQAWKERKSELKESPEIKELREAVREMKQEQKDIEESLSHHLINYHQLTNSTSFDTSEGDQWEFKIKAKVKNRKDV